MANAIHDLKLESLLSFAVKEEKRMREGWLRPSGLTPGGLGISVGAGKDGLGLALVAGNRGVGNLWEVKGWMQSTVRLLDGGAVFCKLKTMRLIKEEIKNE